MEKKYEYSENNCKGCIYDITGRKVPGQDILSLIINRCSSCKRAMRKECQYKFEDLYKEVL